MGLTNRPSVDRCDPHRFDAAARWCTRASAAPRPRAGSRYGQPTTFLTTSHVYKTSDRGTRGG